MQHLRIGIHSAMLPISWIDKMQEYDSGAGKRPAEDRLPTSMRQRASGIEGYTSSITVWLDVDLDGRPSEDEKWLLYETLHQLRMHGMYSGS